MTSARRCSIGSRASADANRSASSRSAASSSGSGSLDVRFDARMESGSIAIGRRTRTASIARLRVIVRSHVMTLPRRGS